MTKMLAFDTSTTATGWALYIDGKLNDYGCLEFKSDIPSDVRFEMMVNKIYRKIDEVRPQIVVTEQTSLSKRANNIKTQIMLTQVLGAVWGKCLLVDAYYHFFTPSEWRKLVDPEKKPRKREELKKWSIDKVNSFLKTEINNDNISDAILIGMAYINLFK